MTILQKLRKLHFSQFISSNNFRSPKPDLCPSGPCQVLQFFRLLATKTAKRTNGVRKQAQNALLDYLHSTRSLRFMDAENMSTNSPEFLNRLLNSANVENDDDVGRSLTRFLRYRPINEFEPFFESIGLSYSDYEPFLPRDFIFLNDDGLLLENYYCLCDYGVPRNMIGKIYKGARDVFKYDYGVLQPKLLAFHDLGLERSLIIKIIASSPYLLRVGGVDPDFIQLLEMFKVLGIDYKWLEEHISGVYSCDWTCMLGLVRFLIELGFNADELGGIIRRKPEILLELSGCTTFRFIGFLLKFGLSKSDLQLVFLQLPPISVIKFSSNLHRCYKFLAEIKMSAQDIGCIFRSHPVLLGSCEVKQVNSLLCILNCGVKRLCQMVKEDPHVLKKWVLRLWTDPVRGQSRVLKVRSMKIQFLLSLGFVENSKEMERALKAFRGKATELQERFDCLVSTGLSREEVIAMLKVAPQILNQSKDVIMTKIGFVVRDMGCPLSDLVTYPATLSFTMERVKLRLLTYEWLKEEGSVYPNLALGTIVSCSDEKFVKTYVNSHPRGNEYWENMKKEILCK
ncbi:Mitochondrial transcription termination factor family protein [Striga hermonthica]|uniref:Mitochondrial transcription termination factor family protein n=1 Tax=Striga hermonthica TaxID=68872 RepID=A0A9N7NJ72_STRHE|nr:Mitochondrial transcription termination factor family protein [Striga hermonthica]